MAVKRTGNIATKVTKRIVIGLIVVFIILIAVVSACITRSLTEREEEKLTLLANENANIAKSFMEVMLNKQDVLLSAMGAIRFVSAAEKINMMNALITSTKAAEESALSVFMVTEPNSFIENSPKGYTIFATAKGTVCEADMEKYINKDLYEKVKETKKMAVVDPFDKEIDGTTYKVITVLKPIINDKDQVVGMIGSNIDTKLLNEAEYNDGGFKTFLTQIICGHQTVITNSRNSEIIGSPYAEVSESTNTQMILDSAKDADPFVFLDTNTDGQKYYKAYTPFFIKGSSVVWLSGTSISQTEFNKPIIRQLVVIGICLAIGLVVLSLVAYVTISKALKPIKKLEYAVSEVAKGNLQVEINVTANDELGRLADGLREATQILSAYISDIDRAMSEMARGNFDLEPTQAFVGDFRGIENSITKFLVNMCATLNQLSVSSGQVSSGAEQVANGAQILARNSEEQSNSIEGLSSEVREVYNHIQQNAENANIANGLAAIVGEKINVSNDQMVAMIDAMGEINSSSEEIGKIIKTIEDIAFQTNILALNAAVEAARAGEAGKGFSVVADEVRNLATKSSEAAKHTNTLIEKAVTSVANGVGIANGTAKSLGEVVEGAVEITALITKISEASTGQAESVRQINAGVQSISAVVQTNSATSEESAATSEELDGQARLMHDLIGKFRYKS